MSEGVNEESEGVSEWLADRETVSERQRKNWGKQIRRVPVSGTCSVRVRYKAAD